MQEGIFQSINSQHITSEANPVRDLIEHYKQSIEAELESISLTTEEVEKEMTREDLESFAEEENIISFPTKDKMH
jgi:hypothetical protein